MNNEWVHVTCGLFNGGFIKVDNYKNMSFVKQNVMQTEKEKKYKKTSCFFCKGIVGIRKCHEKGCQMHTHVYCIFRYMNEQEINEFDVD